MAHNLHRDYEKGRDQFSPQLRQLVERARKVPAVDYVAALAGAARRSMPRWTRCSTNTTRS